MMTHDQTDVPVTRSPPNRELPGLRWARWALWVLLAAAIVFNHGCHGDEDTELLLLGWWP
jgi:hypothetical protein